jgi:hypothetical protein
MHVSVISIVPIQLSIVPMYCVPLHVSDPVLLFKQLQEPLPTAVIMSVAGRPCGQQPVIICVAELLDEELLGELLALEDGDELGLLERELLLGLEELGLLLEEPGESLG